MKTNRFIISTLFSAAALLFAACSEDDLASGVQEGQPVSLQLQVSVPEQESAAMTRASEEAETKIEKLALVFYKKNVVETYKPVVIEIGSDKLGDPTKVSETNYKYTVTLSSDDLNNLTISKGSNDEGLLSGDWYLYAIANYDKKYVSITLDEIKQMTKAKMDAYQTGGSTEQDFVETAVLMSGKYGDDGSITLQPGENALTGDPFLTLRRTISKNIFNFSAADGITFTPTSYTLHNSSSTSTLFERGTRTTTGGYNIGVYDGTDKKVNETTADIAILDNSFTFYTQENSQQGSSDLTTWKYEDREAHVSETDQSFKNAPAYGTYVVVKGTYEGPRYSGDATTLSNYDSNIDYTEIVKGDVTYTIHLGDFSSANGSSYNNFSVLRNVKYTYTVTVNGVNSIVVEAQAESFEETQPGAEGHLIAQDAQTDVTLDAHYEQVLLSFVASSSEATYNVVINTPYTKKNGKVTSLTDADDYKWIEFGKPASTSTFQSYTTLKSNSTLGTLSDLVSDIQTNTSGDGTYFLRENGKIYVAAYVNEYYYTNSNDAKTAGDLDYWEDCNGISDFINADDREMTLTIGNVYTSKDKQSSYTEDALFSIKQHSIKSPFVLDDVNNYFGIEAVEETDAAMINNGGSDTYNASTSSKENGWKNYTQSGAFTCGTSMWSTYVNQATNGWIGNTMPTEATMLNTSYRYAIWFCLTRNRDLNGNGIIDADEIRWYLPAVNQCLDLWLGNNSLPAESRLKTDEPSIYLTSTRENRLWWADEGTAFNGYATNDWASNGKANVLAIRNLVSVSDDPADVFEYDDESRVVTIHGLRSESMRETSMKGEYDSHYEGENPDKVYCAFKIANTYLSNVTYSDATTSSSVGSSYSEDNDAGYWRVPNEKELGLMLRVLGNLEDGTVARTRYNTTSSVYQNANYYHIENYGTPIIAVKSLEYGSDKKGCVRLVRDVTTSSTSAKQHHK